MVNRRRFLGGVAFAPAVAPLALLSAKQLPEMFEMLASYKSNAVAATAVAENEDFWYHLQKAFTVDRTIINLNNGGVSPALSVVQDSMKKYLDFSHRAPVYNMWRILEPQKEAVRKGLAGLFGSSPEEVAITRNTSEGLQICQFGFDLKPGDEVLTTTQDYPRMINTWRQSERRQGIVLRQFSIPVPAEDIGQIVSLFEEQITPKTRLILMCHMINLTGQILPVKEVVQMARSKGVPVIVDGAHTFAHLDFMRADLDCDFYATSLHKWLFAPHGTGMLYVKRDKIGDLWPLMAATEQQDEDIRKFEEIGTHPAANFLATGDAITVHQGIGPARKEARMRYLRDYWANRLLGNERVRLHTSLDPRFSCGLANMQVDGIDSEELTGYLWNEHKILVTTIKHKEFEGIRITPSIYTQLDELNRFCDVVEGVIRNGLPKG